MKPLKKKKRMFYQVNACKKLEGINFVAVAAKTYANNVREKKPPWHDGPKVTLKKQRKNSNRLPQSLAYVHTSMHIY